MTLCNVMTSETKLNTAAIPVMCGAEEARSVADRIADFLDGRTDGADLFHDLYDHVLAEPIPQAMRALLRNH